MSDLNECMDKLGYRFREDGLLRRALTHSSLAVEQHRMGEDNERLEYLGDAVLEHLVSRHLYDTHPEMREGALTRLRSSLVCEEALAAAARRLGLGEYFLLSRGEEQCGGRKKDSILSDAFEAVLAAIYLDGGLAEAQKLVQDYVLCAEGQEKRSSSKDSKTAFQDPAHPSRLRDRRLPRWLWKDIRKHATDKTGNAGIQILCEKNGTPIRKRHHGRHRAQRQRKEQHL